jgi:hypothetical protein
VAILRGTFCAQFRKEPSLVQRQMNLFVEVQISMGKFPGRRCSPLRHPFSPYFNRTDPENNAISKEINGLLDIVALEV